MAGHHDQIAAKLFGGLDQRVIQINGRVMADRGMGISINAVHFTLRRSETSQSFDVWIFHQIKKRTGEGRLWLRNNLSTMSSQVVDTVLYSLVVWWGTVDLRTALALGGVKYAFKVAIAMIDTVFIYWAKATYQQRREEAAATG